VVSGPRDEPSEFSAPAWGLIANEGTGVPDDDARNVKTRLLNEAGA